MWGYTGLGGMVQALGAGYFVWDVKVCAANLELFGMMDLVHAVVALSIATLGFVRPLPCAPTWLSILLSPHADLASVSVRFILWNTVRFGGTLHPVSQHPLVSEQDG